MARRTEGPRLYSDSLSTGTGLRSTAGSCTKPEKPALQMMVALTKSGLSTRYPGRILAMPPRCGPQFVPRLDA